jgi:hypothetical protein
VHTFPDAHDTYLIGPGPAVTAAFRTQQSAVIGLAPSLHKCAVYGTPLTPVYAAAQQTARILAIQHAADGFGAAGTPIGANDYITAHMEDCAKQAIALIYKLQDLPHPSLLKPSPSSSPALSIVA